MSYDPSVTPLDINQLSNFINSELQKIKHAVNSKDFLPLSIRNVAPVKPQIGLYAPDGTNWNPGGGAGVYFYDGSTYTKL